MNTRTLLLTTLLSTTFVMSSFSLSYAQDNITSNTVTTASDSASASAMEDPRVAAAGFVEHINYARVSLAMKNVDLAKKHITQAREMVAMITKNMEKDTYRITELRSGRIIYKYDTNFKYHYFPVQTGPVQVKELSSGSPWAKNNLAVTDADIVYLTLDLRNNQADPYIARANAAIAKGNLKEAGKELGLLTDAVVKVKGRIGVPIDKALDNIALARSFIAGKNYEGARYALIHADKGLDELGNDDLFEEHNADIVAMRKDIAALQGYIAKNDPTLIEKADAKLDKWWNDLQSWSETR